MKRKVTFIILIFMLALATILGACVTQESTFYTLKYLADEGGTIQGPAEQKVKQGNDAKEVTAVADDGYVFVKWSDDVTTATRKDKSVQEDIAVTAVFSKAGNTSYTVTYLVEEGGILEGEAVQTVSKDNPSTDLVSVKARDGYEFMGWSDGNNLPWRYDYYIYNEDSNPDRTYTAKFRRIDTYLLVNWCDENSDGVPSMEITEETYDNITFPIPHRDHFSFEGWYLGDTLVGDTQGKSCFTKELLDDGDRHIVAKWTADETFTYKLLLVYVTRIDAILPHKYPSITEKIHVDYTMSEQEREFCQLVTIRTKQRLDEMMDGLVDFQVDEYFTTKTLTTEDFNISGGDFHISSLWPQKLDETADMVLQYDSVLILYDATRETTTSSGQAMSRYGEVRLDSFFQSVDVQGSSLDEVIDAIKNNSDVYSPSLKRNLVDDTLIDTIRHELAHTIEQRMGFYSYHDVCNRVYAYSGLSYFEINGLYYKQEAVVNGEKVGIPYEFWKGDFATVIYYVTEGKDGCEGYVDNISSHIIIPFPTGSGNSLFEVFYGDMITVMAIPVSNYRFVCWSDGVTTPERTDLITGDFTVTAIFEKIE